MGFADILKTLGQAGLEAAEAQRRENAKRQARAGALGASGAPSRATAKNLQKCTPCAANAWVNAGKQWTK